MFTAFFDHIYQGCQQFWPRLYICDLFMMREFTREQDSVSERALNSGVSAMTHLKDSFRNSTESCVIGNNAERCKNE